MATTKLEVSGRRARKRAPKNQTLFFPEAGKINVALKPEERLLAQQLARVIAMPGQSLNTQDVLRIGLAQLGIVHRKKLEVGTDLATA